jgi:PKD repeat protein
MGSVYRKWVEPRPLIATAVLIVLLWASLGLPSPTGRQGLAGSPRAIPHLTDVSRSVPRAGSSDSPRPDGNQVARQALPVRCSSTGTDPRDCSPASANAYSGDPQNAIWRNVSSSVGNSSPPPAEGASIAFDPVDGYTVLFGGFGTSPSYLNDTWAFENGTWVELHPTVSPSGRVYAGMTWDASDGYVLLFGGMGGTGSLNDTWTFLHGNWSQLTPALSPSARSEEGLAWDSHDGYALMFGGYRDYDEVNDTWSYVHGVWTELIPRVSPPARSQVAMAFDSSSGSVVLFGGYGTSGELYNDTWSFTGGNWTELNPAAAPPSRADASFAYFPAVQSIALYGGYNSVGGYYSDTWWFRDGGWLNESDGISPGPRLLGGLAVAPNCDCLVMFGGASPSTLAKSTWEYYSLNLTVVATPPDGETPLAVELVSSVTADPASYSVAWTFGDGGNGSGTSTSHVYRNVGNYTVEATATDIEGALSVATFQIVVDSPLVFLSVATPLNGTAPLAVTFSASCSGGAPPYSFTWSLAGKLISIAAKANYTFDSPGSYTISVLAIDQFGYNNSQTFTVYVSPTPPSALAVVIGESLLNGPAPLTINFSSSIAGGTPPYSSSWSFGDTAMSTVASPTHTFASPGTYVVQLAVTDSKNDTGFAGTSIRVWSPLTVVGTVSYPEGAMEMAPALIHFSAIVSGGVVPVTVFWQFGDGTAAVGSNVSHVYTSGGTFNASVVGIDGSGVKVSSQVEVTVLPAHPGTSQKNSSSSAVTAAQLWGYAGVAFAVGMMIASTTCWFLWRRQRAGQGPRTR